MPRRRNEPDDELTLDVTELSLEGDELVLDLGEAAVQQGREAAPTVAEAEREAEAEVSEVLQGFKSRAAREEQRFWDAVDTEFWFCLCFQTREQKEEFLKKIGWWDIGDKYLDGMQAAYASDIALDSRVPPMPMLRADRRLHDLAE